MWTFYICICLRFHCQDTAPVCCECLIWELDDPLLLQPQWLRMSCYCVWFRQSDVISKNSMFALNADISSSQQEEWRKISAGMPSLFEPGLSLIPIARQQKRIAGSSRFMIANFAILLCMLFKKKNLQSCYAGWHVEVLAHVYWILPQECHSQASVHISIGSLVVAQQDV